MFALFQLTDVLTRLLFIFVLDVMEVLTEGGG